MDSKIHLAAHQGGCYIALLIGPLTMKIYRSAKQAAKELKSSSIAIGNFDGVHRGHQELLACASRLAHESGGPSVALTFSPHPAQLFNPDLAPPLITSEAQKMQALESCQIDAVVIEPFDKELADLSPREFVEQILVQSLDARHVVVGHGFRFGHKKAGTRRELSELGKEHHFVVHEVEMVRVSSILVSSTKIREFLLLGKVGGASMLLGRDYMVQGPVVPGKARGRTIGIPTANVASENEILPRRGVYAGWVRLANMKICKAVINIGTNPTFEKADVMSLEAHLLDFSGDLYEQKLAVHFTQRLRDEQRFESVDELIKAIHNDIKEARFLLKEPALEIQAL